MWLSHLFFPNIVEILLGKLFSIFWGSSFSVETEDICTDDYSTHWPNLNATQWKIK